MRLLVTGASGLLGGYLLRELAQKHHQVVAWSGRRRGRLFGTVLQPVDLGEPDRTSAAFQAARPDFVLHLGAMASVSECYRDPERARRVNAEGSSVLAELSAKARARLVLVSTDLVFDGQKGWYREDDVPSPLSIYGRTKVAAETAVLAAPRSAVARLSLLFGPAQASRPSFFDQQVRALRDRQTIALFADEWRSPLSLLTAARALLVLIESDVTGVIHLGGPERMSRLEFGQRLAAHLGADQSVLIPTTRASGAVESRPRDTSLDSSLWRRVFPTHPWPEWNEAIKEVMSMM